MHDFTLVADKVLYGKHRGDHLTARAEMIELSPLERHDRYLELVDFWVGDDRRRAKRTAKLPVKVVGGGISILLTVSCEHFHSLVAEYPQTDVGEIEMLTDEVLERFHRWFLQHTFQGGGVFPFRYEYPVGCRHLIIEPKTVTHHVGLGHHRRAFVGSNEHITAHYHGVHRLRCHGHHLLEKRHLQREQVL